MAIQLTTQIINHHAKYLAFQTEASDPEPEEPEKSASLFPSSN
jgi:hypothetical protein